MLKIRDEKCSPRGSSSSSGDSGDVSGGGSAAAAPDRSMIDPDSRENSQKPSCEDVHDVEKDDGARGGEITAIDTSAAERSAVKDDGDDEQEAVVPDDAKKPQHKKSPQPQPSPQRPKKPPQDRNKGTKETSEPSRPVSRSAAVRVNSPIKSHGGLSELSKQLRVLQAKNVSQSKDIDRLERQLLILADLKGVSVSDLRSALTRACEGEAHADLRSQVSKLRAELDAAALTNESTKKGSASFEKESTNRTIADLQLRVGELEEVEETLRKEIRDLYESLREQTARATGLESKLSQKEAQLEEILKSLKVADSERRRSDSLKVDEETSSKAQIDTLTDRLRSAELEMQIEKDKAKLLQDQIDAREKEAKLKNEQTKSRSMVQDERIHDLEQQLSSLYVAFEMLQQERSVETERRSELQSYLNNADSEVARQLNTVEGVEAGAANRTTTRTTVVTTTAAGGAVDLDPPPPAAAVPQTPPQTTPGHASIVAVGTPIRATTPVAVAVATTASPPYASERHGVPIGTRVVLNQLAGTPEHNGRSGVVVSTPEGEDGQQHVYLDTVDVTLSAMQLNMTPEQLSPPPPPPRVAAAAAPSPKVLASGFLLKRENKVLKGWKKRFFVLRGSYGIYQLSYGDGPRQKAKGTFGIATGVSSVTRTKQFFPSQKYAFVLHVNRQAAKAPILCAAASSEEELKKWMSALLTVTKGDVQDMSEGVFGTGGGQQEVDDHAIALRMQSMEFS